MRYTLAVAFLWGALVLSNRSVAQLLIDAKKDSTLPKIEFGVKLGANFQSTSGTTWDHSYKPGILAGINAGMHKNRIGVRIEVLLSTTKYVSTTVTDSIGDKSNIKVVSLNTPVLFEYTIINWLMLQVGPEYSDLLSAKDPNNLNQDPKVNFKGGSFSAVGGLEAKLPMHFSVGARYILGLTNIDNDLIGSSSESWKATTIQGYICYGIQ